jgi:hypothetical protein
LAGSHDLQRTTAALDDAAGRLSRLFLNQLLINTDFGILIGIGLWLIGIPSAILWGILGTVLRFVPYIGSVIAAAFPLTLAVAGARRQGAMLHLHPNRPERPLPDYPWMVGTRSSLPSAYTFSKKRPSPSRMISIFIGFFGIPPETRAREFGSLLPV